MDPTIYVDEIIDVAVIFKNKTCYPIKFNYQNQTIIIEKINLYHKTRIGQALIHVFDVSHNLTDFRLEFNSQTLIWRLVALIN